MMNWIMINTVLYPGPVKKIKPLKKLLIDWKIKPKLLSLVSILNNTVL